jgi:hypothetical protein
MRASRIEVMSTGDQITGAYKSGRVDVNHRARHQSGSPANEPGGSPLTAGDAGGRRRGSMGARDMREDGGLAQLSPTTTLS